MGEKCRLSEPDSEPANFQGAREFEYGLINQVLDRIEVTGYGRLAIIFLTGTRVTICNWFGYHKYEMTNLISQSVLRFMQHGISRKDNCISQRVQSLKKPVWIVPCSLIPRRAIYRGRGEYLLFSGIFFFHIGTDIPFVIPLSLKLSTRHQ